MNTAHPELSTEQRDALDIARALTAVGVPVFVAQADPSSNTGFRLPARWQDTPADPAIVDTWRPGMALAMVMGHGLDLVDVDPRSGGSEESFNGSTPWAYGVALTPSGGTHSFVRSLGIRSRDNVRPGIDIKAGDLEGRGRGFAFIAPTVRTSKMTGEPASYQWAIPPNVEQLGAVLRGELVDMSGEALRALVEEVRASTGARTEQPAYDGPTFDQMTPQMQETVRSWVSRAINGMQRELADSTDWRDGQTDDRGRGWEKLQADVALRLGQLARAVWNDLELSDAQAIFVDAAPSDGTWSTDDVELKWRQQSGRLDPAPWPNLVAPAERDAAGWAALGIDPAAATRAQQPPAGPPPPPGSAQPAAPPPEQPPTGEEVASRYFGPGGIQAITLAADTLARGPLRVGRDDILWSYGPGVWNADKHVVRDRLTWLMGQRFRTGHVGTVEAVVRAYTPPITCDPVPELVNFTNGLLDWRTGELHPHSPDVLSTVQLGVAYNPDAQCPTFERFVTEVVPPDVVRTVWELIGYLMYSGNPLHKAVMLTGTGRNGKGTFLRVLQHVLGRQNITNVSLHDLVNTRFSTVNLFGKLANIAGDIDAGYLENTATFKQITGGDTISAEHKGRDRFDFTPWAVPLFSANKIPASADTTTGYLSRWLVIPFPNSFIGREDRHLDARLALTSELEGVAARAIAALPGLLERGDFEMTESAEAAREDFIRRVDQVRTWLADCCEMGPELPWTARTELYASYRRWADRDGHRPVRASEFYDRLESAGAEPAIVHGTRGFKRIRIIDNGFGAGGPTGFGPFPGPAPTLGAGTALAPAPEAPTTSSGAANQGVTADLHPVLHPDVSAGQAQSIHNQGAEGADSPHPPTRVHAQEGGYDRPAPHAPKPSPRGSAKASATRAEKAELTRRLRVAEASGRQVWLPAVVTRDGVVQHLELGEADLLLASISQSAADGSGAGELTVDVETTGYPVGHEHFAMRTIQLGNELFAVVLDAEQAEHREVAARHLAAAPVLHAHSATADLVPLATYGVLDLEAGWDRMHDTVIPAKLADPASTGADPSLKKISAAVLGDAALSPRADEARKALFKAGKWLNDTEVTTPLEKSGWAQVAPTAETMIRYAASDVLDDAAIARRLPPLGPDLLERERTAQRMTARIASHGIRLDGEHVDRVTAERRTARAEFAETVRGFGIDNPGSDQQVGQALIARGVQLPATRTGKPSVAKGVLEPMRELEGEAGDLVRAVLGYRHHNTALVLLLEPYSELVHRGDGRARPTVYTLGADTGRMSCVRPNLQQVSRTGGLRACFTADPGQLMVSADFASVELRVAAALSGDTGLQAILADPDRDVHLEIARLVWGPQAGKAERYKAKPMVFGRIYGAGVNGLARDNGVSHDVAAAVISAMDVLTPGLAEWSRMVRDGVEAGRTQFPTYSGRIAHLPKLAPHAGPNYCIQGTARELLVDALIRWRRTPWGDSVLFPVHDELVVMVPEHEAEQARAALLDCMTTDLFGVPIVAEADQPSFEWRDSA